LARETSGPLKRTDLGPCFLAGEDGLDPWVALQPFGHLAHAVADTPLTPNIAGLVGGLTLRVERCPTP
jgi:hypothetical protein